MNNDAQKKYKVGISIGKFLPMHLGHISGIQTLSYFCEKVYVLFYNDTKKERTITDAWGKAYPVNVRVADAEKVFKDCENIIIKIIDVPSDITFPNDYLKIKSMVEQLIGCEADAQTFGAEEIAIYEPYKYAREILPGTIHAVENQNGEIVPLHSTLIRNDYDFFKKYLPKVIRTTIDSM